MSVTRYAPQEFWLDGTYARQTLRPKMVETAEGGYASYFNYNALAKQLATSESARKELEERVESLEGA